MILEDTSFKDTLQAFIDNKENTESLTANGDYGSTSRSTTSGTRINTAGAMSGRSLVIQT